MTDGSAKEKKKEKKKEEAPPNVDKVLTYSFLIHQLLATAIVALLVVQSNNYCHLPDTLWRICYLSKFWCLAPDIPVGI